METGHAADAGGSQSPKPSSGPDGTPSLEAHLADPGVSTLVSSITEPADQGKADRYWAIVKAQEELRQRKLDEKRDQLYKQESKRISARQTSEFYQRQVAWLQARDKHIQSERERHSEALAADAALTSTPNRSPLEMFLGEGAGSPGSPSVMEQIQGAFEEQCRLLASTGSDAAARAKALDEFVRRQQQWLAQRNEKMRREREAQMAISPIRARIPSYLEVSCRTFSFPGVDLGEARTDFFFLLGSRVCAIQAFTCDRSS
jgi:hypothetical protein